MYSLQENTQTEQAKKQLSNCGSFAMHSKGASTEWFLLFSSSCLQFVGLFWHRQRGIYPEIWNLFHLGTHLCAVTRWLMTS